jgi:nucleoside-diphosphate-sugar epimerase
MRVLVTGHLGYIGPVVVSELRQAGHDVVGLDTGLFAECAVENGVEVPTIARDLRDITPDDVAGFEAIIHLAGLSNDPLGFLDPALTHEINGTATVRLGRIAREAGVRRFLNSSSCSVYGAPEEPWVDETSALRPVTPYGESKAFAEQGLASLASPSFCVVSFRNATAFGYSPGLRTDLVVNDLASGAYLRGEIRLNSDGSAWRPLIHVRDIARVFLLGLTAPSASINGAIINVGADSQNYTVIEIARTVSEMIPGATVTFAEGAGKDRRSYRTRFERLRHVLPDFTSSFDLRTGIQDLLDNFRRLDLRSTEGLVRLAHLQRLIAGNEVDASLRVVASSRWGQ